MAAAICKSLFSCVIIIFFDGRLLVQSAKTEKLMRNSLHTNRDLLQASKTVAVDYSCLHANSWKMNANNQYDYSSIFSSYTEILSSSLSSSSWSVSFNQIPFYETNFSTLMVSKLNTRPKASTDFVDGHTTATANHIYPFGSNIGYAGSPCQLGYWPPGPVCPTASTKSVAFKLNPAPETSSGKFRRTNLSHCVMTSSPISWLHSAAGRTRGLDGQWSRLLRMERYDELQQRRGVAEHRDQLRVVRFGSVLGTCREGTVPP